MNSGDTNSLHADLKKRIMRKVYFMWLWKSVAPLLAVEVILLLGVGLGVLTHISLKNILLNAISSSADFRAFIVFFVNNFFVKSIQSRLLVVAYLAVAFFFGRDLRNALRRLGRAGTEELLSGAALTGNQR